MKKFLYNLSCTIALGSAIFVTSCQKSSEDPSEDGSSYMPLEIGKYITYDVDSLYWDSYLKTEIPRHWQMRYHVVDTFRDLSNRLTYTINVYKRLSAAHPFEADNVVHVTPTVNRIEYRQKNLAFIPLIFPVSNGASWDGIALISDADYQEFNSNEWNYQYSNIGASYDNGLLQFNNTLTVNHIDEQINDPDTDPDAYAEKRFSMEKYANGIGLIEKEFIYWEYQAIHGYRNGYSVKMKIVDHN